MPGRGGPSPRPALAGLSLRALRARRPPRVCKNQSVTGECFTPVARAEHWTEQGKPRRGRSQDGELPHAA